MAAAQGIYIFEFFKKVSIFWRVHSLTGLFWFKSIGPLEKYKCGIWPQCLGFRSAEHPHVQMKASHCRFNVLMSLKLGYNKYDWSWVQSVIVSLALREKVFFLCTWSTFENWSSPRNKNESYTTSRLTIHSHAIP